jgi:hypothetical protein
LASFSFLENQDDYSLRSAQVIYFDYKLFAKRIDVEMNDSGKVC